MSKSTSVFATISLALAIVTIYLWQQLRDERALNAEKPDPTTLQAVQPLPVVRVGGPATPEPQPTAEPAVPPPAALPPKPATTVVKPATSVRTKQDMMQLRYPDLAEQLGLTLEQTEALFDFLTRQQSERLTESELLSLGSEPEEQARLKREELARRQKGELANYLGPARQQKWEQYERTLEARRSISELVNVMASSGDPITDAQKQRLINTVLAEQERRAGEESLRAYPNMDRRAQLDMELQNLNGREESFRRIQESASTYLTPAQFAAMKASQDQQIESSRRALEAQLAALDGGG